MRRVLHAALACASLALLGCTSPTATARPTLRAGAEEREKVACTAGHYPLDLGPSALAQARYQDIEAQRNGAWSTFATARLLDERAQFDKRCEAWRQAASAEEHLAVK